MITLFDLASSLRGQAWSPNTWKTRLCLKHKGLSFQTVWVEWPDIQSVAKRYNFEPIGRRPDGSPHYAVPAILDDRPDGTRVALSDSWKIARYLETTYPETPRLISLGDPKRLEMEESFPAFFRKATFVRLARVTAPAIVDILNQPSKMPFSKIRAIQIYGKDVHSLDQIQLSIAEKAEVWRSGEEGLGLVGDKYFAGNGVWSNGENLSWNDVVVAAFLVSLQRIFGEGSEEWAAIRKWHGERWGVLFDEVQSLGLFKLEDAASTKASL